MRTAAGLTRTRVAAAIGVTPETVRKWETGVTDPSGEHRAAYGRLLDGLAARYPAPAPPAPESAAPGAAAPAVSESSPARAARESHRRHQQRRTTTTAEATRGELRERIAARVSTELERAGGDTDAAAAALIKKAIPDVMELFAATRRTARYEHTSYPSLPQIFERPAKGEANLIWEARPSWRHPGLRRSPDGPLTVTALDVNAAYLSALKTHLPIGRLEHTTGGGHDRRRAGVHLIDPPAWHHPTAPNPLGDREETGPVWVTEPTLRLLLQLAGPKHRLIETPRIHESWTSGATEALLDGLRQTLAEARTDAIATGDDVTLTYLKAMYSRFVSTIGDSSANREMMRPDWTHIIRSQAFANLWRRAHKAAAASLTVVSIVGTDELHVAGDWRTVWTEGTGLSEMKVKTTPRTGEPVTYTMTEVA
ncbi:helix-turn-helix domain-containing protein [Streptomyces calidiresistens]|uniref:Helix-turn-helix domain-containing protein n=1 Tax=Streptomyces calidiresistens TaxID=1485586 RepID=A0A7W3T5K5_9ACTN|nr:helix-turn-helix domain-containing protein [Streptomyces calidiresistens]